MFRTLITSAVLALGLFAGVGLTGTVSAAQPLPVRPNFHSCGYAVQYREDCHCRWRCYGTYDDLCEARDVARDLNRQGYEVRVVPA